MGPIMDGPTVLGGIAYVCIAYGLMLVPGSLVGVAATFIGAGARDIWKDYYPCGDRDGVVLKYVQASNSHGGNR